MAVKYFFKFRTPHDNGLHLIPDTTIHSCVVELGTIRSGGGVVTGGDTQLSSVRVLQQDGVDQRISL